MLTDVRRKLGKSKGYHSGEASGRACTAEVWRPDDLRHARLNPRWLDRRRSGFIQSTTKGLAFSEQEMRCHEMIGEPAYPVKLTWT